MWRSSWRLRSGGSLWGKGRGESMLKDQEKGRSEGKVQARGGVRSKRSAEARDGGEGIWVISGVEVITWRLKMAIGMADVQPWWPRNPCYGCWSLLLQQGVVRLIRGLRRSSGGIPQMSFCLLLSVHTPSRLPGAKFQWIMGKPLLLLLSDLPTEIINPPRTRDMHYPQWLTVLKTVGAST